MLKKKHHNADAQYQIYKSGDHRRKVQGKGVEDREAYFTCALCLYLSPTRIYVIQEEAKGKIALTPSTGKEGFGYDPVFFSDEAGQIVADLPLGEKGKYSHRGKAARVMYELIKKEIEK